MTEEDTEVATTSNIILPVDLSKIFSEKYKIIADKKKLVIDGLKLLIWLYATCIILNYISLNTQKIFGLFPVEYEYLGLYATNTMCFAFGIVRIIFFIFDNSFDNALTARLPEQHSEAEEEWIRLSSEFRVLIENDLKIINGGKLLYYWSLKWLAVGFILSLSPIGIKLYYGYFP